MAIFTLAFILTITHEAFTYSYSFSNTAAPPALIITEIYPNTNTKKRAGWVRCNIQPS